LKQKSSNNKDCCSDCVGEKRKENDKIFRRKYNTPILEFEDVVCRFKQLNHIPMFLKEDYIGNSVKLKCLCVACNEIAYVSLSNLQTTGKCSKCGMKSRKDKLRTKDEIVIEEFKKQGLIVLNISKYKNKDSKIEYLCNIHNKEIQKTTLSTLRKTKISCKFCRYENSLIRITRAIRSRLSHWKAEILSYYDGKCIISNSVNCDVHHIYSLQQMIKDELDKTKTSLDSIEKDVKKTFEFIEIILSKHNKKNGILLSKELHNKLHKLYGNSPTREELYDFIEKEKQQIIIGKHRDGYYQ
jgi:hypothetical protein